MTDPTFGMTFSRPEDEPVPVTGADFSKGLLIETSEDADAVKFPVDEPVRVSTSDSETIAKIGTGNLLDGIKAINSQLGPLNSGADVTISRVAEGADVAATTANIVAALGQARYIPSEVNATPRLIWAGRTAWRQDLLTTNPVVAALPEVCDQLLAIAPVDVDDTSTANAIDARESMSSQRLMPIGVAARVYEGVNLVTRPMAPRVLGLFMRVDNQHNGKPFDPIANQSLQGLAGLSRNIPFSLLDGSTEGQQLLEGDVSIVAQGEVGVDGAISDGGFVFIGTDNAETGELWQQIHQVRGADYITTELIKITRQFLGLKITADMVEAWIKSMEYMLRDHVAFNDILGYDVDFKASLNSPEQIRLGNLTVNLGIEPAPVFKKGRHEIRRYRPALVGLVEEIIARVNADT